MTLKRIILRKEQHRLRATNQTGGTTLHLDQPRPPAVAARKLDLCIPQADVDVIRGVVKHGLIRHSSWTAFEIVPGPGVIHFPQAAVHQVLTVTGRVQHKTLATHDLAEQIFDIVKM
eukprot:CAMPEP_0204428134 /NCGR_PEP_ID=MMETSP0470-20130426/56970_1 /ASSEMBLY_ACC=CAM_ASM_000385 /TAXON_ID=2969 /ORGANISM="Oxyrrhis marina" /LENGTH=116 /DNA_ID=CAMNT_0051426015 /DNA_START=91 /DNA_END=442 /DNA_ORIENTATION=+